MSGAVQPSLLDLLAELEAPEIGWLITFTPCGHVQHCYGEPTPGTWVSCSWRPGDPGCQTGRQVAGVRPCLRRNGCPDCREYPWERRAA